MAGGIFVSYSHSDIDKVKRIIDLVERTVDFPVWYDSNLKGGEAFFSVIAQQILDNPYFIFMVSEKSVNSSWCIHELEFAMSEGKKIIAIWLEDAVLPPRVRLVISNTHYIKHYELDDAMLMECIADSFSGNIVSGNTATGNHSDGNERENTDKKYFITADEHQMIKKCLEAEKNGRFSVCFEAKNAKLLGLAYEMGVYTEPDMKKADFYYSVGMFKKDPDCEFLYYMLKLQSPDADVPFIVGHMDELAQNGSVMAMVYWGDEYYYGGNYGITENKQKAYGWWKAAAEKNDPTAQYYMAYSYRWGECVEPDYKIAFMYALLSAEKGFPRAYRIIAFMYERGDCFEKDTEKAKHYFNVAVEKGDLLSYNYLGNIEYKNKEYEKACEYYKKACDYTDNGKIKSGKPYYNYAWSLEHGEGVEKMNLLPLSIISRRWRKTKGLPQRLLYIQ